MSEERTLSLKNISDAEAVKEKRLPRESIAEVSVFMLAKRSGL